MADDVGKPCEQLHPPIGEQHIHVWNVDGSYSHSINSKGDRL